MNTSHTIIVVDDEPVIIALVGEEATCKYYYPEIDRVRLVPANDTMQDIVISKTDIAAPEEVARLNAQVSLLNHTAIRLESSSGSLSWWPRS